LALKVSSLSRSHQAVAKTLRRERRDIRAAGAFCRILIAAGLAIRVSDTETGQGDHRAGTGEFIYRPPPMPALPASAHELFGDRMIRSKSSW
jgi:hypothetical protein